MVLFSILNGMMAGGARIAPRHHTMTPSNKPAAAAPPAEPSPAESMLKELEAFTPEGIPNLADVITAQDISTKGTGSYAADYVNWARVAHLLHQHAPGWEFHLTPSPDGTHVWSAPNGTAYLVGHFTGPNGHRTPDFPQAVMDNRNAPKAMNGVSARDVTDTHRRCLCTAAAATFGLAWQLWAKEQVEDPNRPDEAPAGEGQPPARRESQQQRARPAATAAQPAQPTPEQQALTAARKRCLDLGLTAAGAAAAATELTQGQSQLFSSIPLHILQRMASEGVPADVIARWNAANAPAAAGAAA